MSGHITKPEDRSVKELLTEVDWDEDVSDWDVVDLLTALDNLAELKWMTDLLQARLAAYQNRLATAVVKKL